MGWGMAAPKESDNQLPSFDICGLPLRHSNKINSLAEVISGASGNERRIITLLDCRSLETARSDSQAGPCDAEI